ncbi:NAD(P)-binding domain-containing protein [Arthrobacter sp. I2-34]|uniref:NAD(P)-binding domain-containing protein n=1 Tax=Arthrobacter hankyongi TaxID=2904801 RepID=A0ABS9L9R4_9MICC|nr:NAD(P)-binding domain-containing protein [Arthrobacter hankyongi]MCG2623323.1 NAD(P)-binding domain-containing protein [Arthrobacter hankyongi]
MKISVLGTGNVGRFLAAKIAHAGHAVVVGTRDPGRTLARADTSPTGAPPLADWHAGHRNIPLVTLAEAGGHGELIVNATAGAGSLAALHAAGPHDGKIIMDVANPLDFSAGFPPSLSVCNTDSLAEQIQREFPAARVVKTLNTMNHVLMTDPGRLPGPHNVFVAGEDAAAKATVSGLLQQFGWPEQDILDLGGIASARGMEMYLPLWLDLMRSLGSWDFNIRIVRPEP